jgi:hypothetical protein
MTRANHGRTSFAMFIIAVLFCVYRVGLAAPTWVLAVYLVLTVAGFAAMLAVYCAKCTARESCPHGLPGFLVRFFPDRRGRDYTWADYIISALSLVAILGVPQPWLWGDKPVFFAFWAVMAFIAADLVLFQCPCCPNQACPLAGSGETNHS